MKLNTETCWDVFLGVLPAVVVIPILVALFVLDALISYP